MLSVTARLNARVQPIDRGEYFEDPLADWLEAHGYGEVVGGGTQLADEPAGIEFCDVEVDLTDDTRLDELVAKLEELGAPKGSRLLVGEREIPLGQLEGLGLFLNGTDLPDEVYATCDVNHVVAELDRLMGEAGRFRGYWEGSRETALYCYGPSFAAMQAAIAPLLASYPLCQRSRVEQVA